MGKLPRNLDAKVLIKILKKLDYYEVRQTGSHIRLQKENDDGTKVHITIPNHSPIKIGTLNTIIRLLAIQLKMEKNILIDYITHFS